MFKRISLIVATVLVAHLLLAADSLHGDDKAREIPTSSRWQQVLPSDESEAGMQETEDAVVYRAGPTQDEVEQQKQEEREKAERAWDMLSNMPIIIEGKAPDSSEVIPPYR